MTYDESGKLMEDQLFRKRVKVSVLKYATYIMGEDPATVAHNSRYKWAQLAGQQPDQTAIGLQPMVVMDPSVQSAGVDGTGNSLATDAVVQTAVEYVVNKII